SGDTLEISQAMSVERVYANPRVSADAGLAALRRGPLVYCFEEVDNPIALHRLSLASDSPLEAIPDPNLLGGTVVIRGTGIALDDRGWDGTLYRGDPPASLPFALTAIPYHAWDNRGQGQMRVWLREATRAASDK
ncbi:MAG: glycoside hydrolase family 127 protein, partial [Chloroflexota bacterium]